MNERDTAALKSLTDVQLSRMVKNYEDQDVVTGGKWPLAELRLEQSRRGPSQFDPKDIVEAIIRLCGEADDHKVSYKAIWNAFRPDTPWQAFNSQKQVTNGLYKVGSYCVDQGLPMLSVLVVPSGTRVLTDEAARNIWAFALSLGVDAGPDARAYVAREAAKASDLVGAAK
jgi:hypothetical protein